MKQDDNLTSILIIIVMQILAEILENKWKESKISLTQCFHNSNIYNIGGILIRQKNNRGKDKQIFKDMN